MTGRRDAEARLAVGSSRASSRVESSRGTRPKCQEASHRVRTPCVWPLATRENGWLVSRSQRRREKKTGDQLDPRSCRGHDAQKRASRRRTATATVQEPKDGGGGGGSDDDGDNDDSSRGTRLVRGTAQLPGGLTQDARRCETEVARARSRWLVERSASSPRHGDGTWLAGAPHAGGWERDDNAL